MRCHSGQDLFLNYMRKYQDFSFLVWQNYGCYSIEEFASYLHLNRPKFNNNNINKKNL